jgi:hypothetical protein
MKLYQATLLASAWLATASSGWAQASQDGSTLNILGSPAEDVITVVFDAQPGSATVFGVPGTPDGTQFLGVSKLVARTFASKDILNVQSLSATPPELDIDTGDGDSQVLVDIQTPFGQLPTYSKALIRGGAGKDSTLFQVTDNAPGATFDWSVFAGEGENDASVKFSSDVLGGATVLNWRYFGGASTDKVLIDGITKADLFEVNALGLTGGGGDEWLITTSGNANTLARVQTSARMGAGVDTARVSLSNCGSSVVRGAIDGGAGDDLIEVLSTSNMAGSPLLLGGLGNDVLVYNAQLNLLADASPQILAGEGNDTVSMLVSGAVLGKPFSDGGPGNDSFVGVGLAINFE